MSSPPIVALHGFTGRADAWDEVLPARGLALSGHAPDLPVPAGWTFGDEVARLSDRVAALGAPVHLCGYSMGGRLALALALARPELVARLTLVGAHPGIDDPGERAARRAADESWCCLLEERGVEAFVAAWEAQPMWASQRALPSEVLKRQRRARLAHDPRALAAALRALGTGAMPPLGARLGELAVPVDLVAGALDERYLAIARRMAAAVKRARVIAIDRTGHNPLIEAPAALARALGFERDGRRTE